MQRSALVPSLAAIALAAAPAVAADVFTIDPTHSNVGFKVTHMMVSKVRGGFTDFRGTIRLDADDMSRSSVEVTIRTASIDTGNPDRDTHLRSADFLDADQYPEITFASTRVEKNADGSGYVAHGELTVRGVTRDLSLKFSINGPVADPWGNRRIGIEIQPITINRQDYGVSWSKTLDTGGLVVSDQVTLDLAVEATHKPDGAEVAS